MKLFLALGAVISALTIGVCAAHAGSLDIGNVLPHIDNFPDFALAMSFMPMAGRQAHALVMPDKVPLVHARPRGLIGMPRADAGDAKKILAELQQTFEAFKASNEEELKELKKKVEDPVAKERTDRINNDISKLTASLDEVNKIIAALQVGGAGDDLGPDQKAHATAFDKYFRKGVEADLGELQVKAALTTQSDTDGGYLVPAEVDKTIDRVLGAVSVMRQLATVMPIGTNEYKKLVSVGGAGYGWVGEEEARPETATPTLKELIFTVMEIYANPATTRNMLDDGIIDIGAWLADEVNLTFAEQEGAAFINGNGFKKPRGIYGYDTVDNSSYAWGKLGFVKTGAAADFVTGSSTVNPADNLLDLLYALKQGYRNNASFLMSDPVMGKVRKFKDGDGNYIWAAPNTTEKVPTIFGKPAYTDDNMQAVGANTFPVAVGDFKRGYLIVDRQGVRVLRDELTRKPYVQFYTTKRVGGGVSNFEAIKLLKCSA